MKCGNPDVSSKGAFLWAKVSYSLFILNMCTGIYWDFEILQYWKTKIVLENVLACTGISPPNLAGHPETNKYSQLGCISLVRSLDITCWVD